MTTRLTGRLAMGRPRLRLPRRTVRFRLTVIYSGLFLAAGAGLLTITYLLVDRSTATALFADGKNGGVIAVKGPPQGSGTQLRHGSPTTRQMQIARQLTAQAAAQHAKDLHQLLTQSGIALAIMAVLAIALGWVVAGRVLRPLRAMQAAAQQITERSLHERLAFPGPADEVKDLADTIDGLLARLETAFEAQRHFVASASHELRTPLTLDRALLEVALADPGATAEDLRSTCQDLLVSGEQQERLIEALLTLASSERGLDRRERFNLAAVTARAVSAHRVDAEHRGLQVGISLGNAVVAGDPDLAERMAANLMDNAIRHNVPGGRLDVRTETRDARAVLAVGNTGPPVPQDQAGRLFEPFQRLSGHRATHPDGHGLGLSIVRAIAAAHDAGLKVLLRPGGGLNVEVHFPEPDPQANGHGGTGMHASNEDQIRRKARSPIEVRHRRSKETADGATPDPLWQASRSSYPRVI
jgi:signal transduction histidine kinase